MRIVRFCHSAGTCFGVLEGDVITALEGDPLERIELTDRTVALGEVRLLAPVVTDGADPSMTAFTSVLIVTTCSAASRPARHVSVASGRTFTAPDAGSGVRA